MTTPPEIGLTSEQVERFLEALGSIPDTAVFDAMVYSIAASASVERMTPLGRLTFVTSLRVRYPEAFGFKTATGRPPAAVGFIPVPLVDGFYWVDFGEPTIAERCTNDGRTTWYTIGSDDYYVGDKRVEVLAGPIVCPIVSVRCRVTFQELCPSKGDVQTSNLPFVPLPEPMKDPETP